MNPLAIVGLLSAITQGIPEIATAIAAISKTINGEPLTPADYQALGEAVVAAHNRVQAGGAALVVPAVAPVAQAAPAPLDPPQPAA